jgi:hypothetical protein
VIKAKYDWDGVITGLTAMEHLLAKIHLIKQLWWFRVVYKKKLTDILSVLVGLALPFYNIDLIFISILLNWTYLGAFIPVTTGLYSTIKDDDPDCNLDIDPIIETIDGKQYLKKFQYRYNDKPLCIVECNGDWSLLFPYEMIYDWIKTQDDTKLKYLPKVCASVEFV